MEETLIEMSEESRYVLSLDLMHIRDVQFRKHPRWFQRTLAQPDGGPKAVSWFDHHGRLKDNPDVLDTGNCGEIRN